MAKKSFLRFEEVPNDGKKTKKFKVFNNSNDLLGWIHWRSSWRRYVYGTGINVTEYDVSCLNEICDFIQNLMLKKIENDSISRRENNGVGEV